MAADPPPSPFTRCDALIEAIEARLGLAGQGARTLEQAPELSAHEALHLRLLYLRRIHHYDYLGGGQFSSHIALLTACGEAHLPSKVLVPRRTHPPTLTQTQPNLQHQPPIPTPNPQHRSPIPTSSPNLQSQPPNPTPLEGARPRDAGRAARCLAAL